MNVQVIAGHSVPSPSADRATSARTTRTGGIVDMT